MALYRRTWLKLIAHSPWLTLFFGDWLGAQQAGAALPTRDLELLVDMLVPADESPGAVELGIHLEIEASVRSDREYQALLASGLAWLDRQSETRFQARFRALPEEPRELLLTAAEKSPRHSAQYRLFTVLRTDVMRRYYTHPDAWTGLGYKGPPQPLGFTDYAKPPSMRFGS